MIHNTAEPRVFLQRGSRTKEIPYTTYFRKMHEIQQKAATQAAQSPEPVA